VFSLVPAAFCDSPFSSETHLHFSLYGVGFSLFSSLKVPDPLTSFRRMLVARVPSRLAFSRNTPSKTCFGGMFVPAMTSFGRVLSAVCHISKAPSLEIRPSVKRNQENFCRECCTFVWELLDEYQIRIRRGAYPMTVFYESAILATLSYIVGGAVFSKPQICVESFHICIYISILVGVPALGQLLFLLFGLSICSFHGWMTLDRFGVRVSEMQDDSWMFW